MGHGTVHLDHGRPVYEGTVPFADGQRVYIITEEHYVAMVRCEASALMSSGAEMPKGLFDYEDGTALLPDELMLEDRRGGKYRLFLDRHLYGLDMSRAMWVRYVSIDQATDEEDMPESWEFPGE